MDPIIQSQEERNRQAKMLKARRAQQILNAKSAARKAAIKRKAAVVKAALLKKGKLYKGSQASATQDVSGANLPKLRFKTPYPNWDTRLIVPGPATAAHIRGIGKVLHLPSNPAGQMSTQAQAMRRLGVDARFCNYSSKTRFGYPTDIPSPLKGIDPAKHGAVMMQEAMKAAHEYDILHFHAGQTFTYTSYAYTDLPYLSLFNKKMVMTYWGSEVRRLSVAKRNNAFARARVTNEKEILRRLSVISRYMDAAIAPDYEMFEYMKGFFPKAYLIRQAVDHRNIVPAYSGDVKRPLVVHAPSNAYIKGTEYVNQAVGKLQKSLKFDYVQIENMTHSEAMKWYAKADIIVDQLCLGIYSILSIEGMLLGKPVITHVRDDLRKTYPEGLPVVSANPATITEQLHDLLTNPEKRRKLGKKGRSYAVKHHDPERIARQIIRVYSEL